MNALHMIIQNAPPTPGPQNAAKPNTAEMPLPAGESETGEVLDFEQVTLELGKAEDSLLSAKPPAPAIEEDPITSQADPATLEVPEETDKPASLNDETATAVEPKLEKAQPTSLHEAAILIKRDAKASPDTLLSPTVQYTPASDQTPRAARPLRPTTGADHPKEPIPTVLAAPATRQANANALPEAERPVPSMRFEPNATTLPKAPEVKSGQPNKAPFGNPVESTATPQQAQPKFATSPPLTPHTAQPAGDRFVPSGQVSAPLAAAPPEVVAQQAALSKTLPSAAPVEPKVSRDPHGGFVNDPEKSALRATNTAQPTRPNPPVFATPTLQSTPHDPRQFKLSDNPIIFDALIPTDTAQVQMVETTQNRTSATPLAGSLSLPAIARQLADVMPQLNTRQMTISLSPDELGKVQLSLSPAEKGMVVTIIAERVETMDLLRRNIAELGQEFQAMGYDSIEFSFAQDQAQNGPSDAEEDSLSDNEGQDTGITSDTPKPTIQLSLGAATSVDIRL